MPRAILVSPKDNVCVAVEPVKKGDEIIIEDAGDSPIVLVAATDIPIYHKAALFEINKGASVIKYGEEIGLATADIPKGSHVHVHNVESRSLFTQ